MPSGDSSVRHPEDAYVRADGMRDLTMESRVRREGDRVLIKDAAGSKQPVVAVMQLTPDALDWLIDTLPHDDGVTEQLRYARKLAKEALWDRAVTSS